MATLATTVETYVSCTSPLQQRHPRNYLSIPPSTPRHRRSTSRLRTLKTELSDFALHSPHSPIHALASLRLHTLTYLAELETRLSSIEPALVAECLKAKGEAEVEKSRVWRKTTLDMLARIRADVASHLPDMPLLLSPRTPTTPDSMLSPLVEPKTPDVDTHLDYVPQLSAHLHSLQSHLASVDIPHSIAESIAKMKPHTSVQELIRLTLAPKFVDPTVDHSKERDGEDEAAKAEIEIARSLRKSCNGGNLVEFCDLPKAWQSNPFVNSGYRYADHYRVL